MNWQDLDLEKWQSLRHAAIKQVRTAHIKARAPWLMLAEHWDACRRGATQSRYDLELGIVRSGRMRRFQGEHAFDVGPGEIWLSGMWEARNWEILEEPCQEMLFVIAPEVLVGQHFPEMAGLQWLTPFMVAPPHRPRVPEAQRARVQQLAELGAELHHREHGRAVALSAPSSNPQMHFHPTSGTFILAPPAPEATCLRMRLLVNELLLLLLESWQQPLSSRGEPFSQINPAITQVLQSRRAITVAQAAHTCGLNRNLFARRFRELMGLSFSQFDLRHRLNGVEGDLLKGREPIKVIAARWGFADGPHLQSCFLRHYACTPNQFRRAPPPEIWRAGPSAPEIWRAGPSAPESS